MSNASCDLGVSPIERSTAMIYARQSRCPLHFPTTYFIKICIAKSKNELAHSLPYSKIWNSYFSYCINFALNKKTCLWKLFYFINSNKRLNSWTKNRHEKPYYLSKSNNKCYKKLLREKFRIIKRSSQTGLVREHNGKYLLRKRFNEVSRL